MSRKFFKTAAVSASVCALLLMGAGLIRTGSLVYRNHNKIKPRFEQIDSVFMNQLKINDEVSEELKEFIREQVKNDPHIASVSIEKNAGEIFSAEKTDTKGTPAYNVKKNLIVDLPSRPYSIGGTEIYTINVRFRILSETDMNSFFFGMLISFIILSMIITACALIPLKRKKSPAGPLFDEIEDEIHHHEAADTQDASHKGKDAAECVRIEKDSAIDPIPGHSLFSEESETSSDEDEDDDILDLDDLTADEQETEDDEENRDSDFDSRTETDEIEANSPVIDFNFKGTSFEAAAGDLIRQSIDKKENCILLTSEFHSTVDEKKDPVLQEEWESVLTNQGALIKQERKKTVAVFPRFTLTDGIKLIQDFRDTHPDRENYMWNAGITALNGRKLRYEEMLNEAERALIKSQLDNDNTVVCFNADAEKYNRYSKID